MSPKTIIAAAYELLVRLETRIVPPTAVPNDEPRLEMQRDKPDISPCRCSREGGLHDVDGRGQHHSDPQTDEQESGREGPRAGRTLDEREQDRDSRDRRDEPRDDERPLGVSLGETFSSE